MHHVPEREIAERPSGYQGPNLSPVGLKLLPQELAPGVVALMANLPPKDNNGLVVGERSALIVDAGITSQVSQQIQELAGGLSDRPVRYVANTTYHGDHTFGNAAFPAEVTVVSSRLNKANMSDLAFEKKIRSGNMYGDEGLLDADKVWRLPDVVFESFMEIDLGGKLVQLWHFGPGNGPGDTIVYVPEARTAWTGNFLCAAGTAHMLLQGGPEPYIESLIAMRAALPDLKTIVPGHGPMGDGPQSISWLIDYLDRLRADVTALHDSGCTVEETLEQCASPFDDGLDPRLLAGLATYQLPRQAVAEQFLALCRNLHNLNILAVFRLLESQR